MIGRRAAVAAALAALGLITPGTAAPEDAREIVRAAWEHWRGTTSQGEMTMTIV